MVAGDLGRPGSPADRVAPIEREVIVRNGYGRVNGLHQVSIYEGSVIILVIPAGLGMDSEKCAETRVGIKHRAFE
jgi:hypothetical protein